MNSYNPYIFLMALLFGMAATLKVHSQCTEDNNFWEKRWASCEVSDNPNPQNGPSHWLMYEFDEAIQITNVHVWNSNRPGESDQGANEVVLEVSRDGLVWETVNGSPFEFPKAPETDDYEGFDVISLDGFGRIQKVLLTVTSTHGNDCASIGEIRFDINPDACDGIIDECGICNGEGLLTFYLDADNDGEGNPNIFVQRCEAPENGYVANNTDTCDTGGWEQVGALFENNGCIGCHGANSESGLDLRSYEGFINGGNKCGSQIQNGNTLVNIINNPNYEGCGETVNGLSMNDRVGGALDEFEIASIQAWVDAGVPEGRNCEREQTSLTFVTPNEGDTYEEGVSPVVELNINNRNIIRRVALYINNLFVRNEGIYPYQWGLPEQNDELLQNLRPGVYTLRAVALDNFGEEFEASIGFTVVDALPNIAPELFFVSPESNTTVALGTEILVEVNATDQNDAVAFVDLYLDGNLVRKDEEAPYFWGGRNFASDAVLNNLEPGIHHLRAIAFDQSMDSAESSVFITVEEEVADGNGENEEEEEGFLPEERYVYPNPSLDGIFRVTTESEPDMITTVDLYDMGGALLQSYEANTSTEAVIDASGLPFGSYILVVEYLNSDTNVTEEKSLKIIKI